MTSLKEELKRILSDGHDEDRSFDSEEIVQKQTEELNHEHRYWCND